MAPIAPRRPSARTLRHQRVTGQIHPLLPPKIFREDAQTSDSFLKTSKSDKRTMKHSSFLSRVASSAASSSSAPSRTKITKKHTRRPSKKLKTNLEDLMDALPEVSDDGMDPAHRGKPRCKSLKGGKGALKRKEMLVRGEMKRFGVSLARLTEDSGINTQGEQDSVDGNRQMEYDAKEVNGGEAGKTANRWAALREHISSTMEQNPAFASKKT